MLRVNLCGLQLKNPLILASGIIGVSASLLRRIAVHHSVGAVTTKSIGPAPRIGYPNPSIIEIEYGTYLNAVGLANPGVDEFVKEIEDARVDGVPLIASLFGSTESEYAEIAGKMEKAGADAVELNISCPHAEVSSIGADPDLTRRVVELVKQKINIPVFVKLNPNVTDLVEIGVAAEKGGADALVAINTIRGMVIDVEIQKPILYNKFGGVSGKAIKPMAVKAVFDLFQNVKIPIIGCGGIFSGNDVVEFFLAGASAVQVGTAFTRGFDVAEKIIAEMLNYLESHSIERLTDLIGKAH
ncbi:MAG: dihydroorotate dehydrogenase [Promethearchaeota archaeon]